MISRIIGKQSGFYGVSLSSVVGSIALIPSFIAFPTAALILNGIVGTCKATISYVCLHKLKEE